MTYEIGGGWGNHVDFFSYAAGSEKQRIYGHKSRRPAQGDILLCAMQSGQVARFEFLNVEPNIDPSDMFFADVVFKEYQ